MSKPNQLVRNSPDWFAAKTELEQLLIENDWNLTAASRILHIRRESVRRRMQDFGLGANTTCVVTDDDMKQTFNHIIGYFDNNRRHALKTGANKHVLNW